MDALKNAGRAIIKSPGVPRHTWGTSKHEKLPENWTDTKETLLEGMAFNLKYLGMTLVGQPKGEDMAAAAIRRIVTTARAGAKKFRKVTLTVSPKGIVITDTDTADLVENVSIYRISYCTADKSQDKVFAYVSQSAFNETLECHAFLCQKKKIAQAVTLTVAQAFKVALDLWELAQQDKSRKARSACCSCAAATNGHGAATDARCLPAGKKIQRTQFLVSQARGVLFRRVRQRRQDAASAVPVHLHQLAVASQRPRSEATRQTRLLGRGRRTG
ncbi:low density lipoprotein receptor adapter protein 1-B isoform X4 [Syngnathus scovelli]|uniref:low density lipoprotein receptor adapter protein 1-B isoform X4 n=1 Tax=Syngnathus scovelli TaxID=161590 RepID=UPI00210F41F4|nr:low density lipoprotein receptor adapter protein 1-B isoform X4 [Syngnathus scovelli]